MIGGGCGGACFAVGFGAKEESNHGGKGTRAEAGVGDVWVQRRNPLKVV